MEVPEVQPRAQTDAVRDDGLGDDKEILLLHPRHGGGVRRQAGPLQEDGPGSRPLKVVSA